MTILSCYNYNGDIMKKRIISAIIALIIVIPLIIIGGTLFHIGVGIVGIIGFYEFLSIKNKENKVPNVIKILSILLFVIVMLSTNCMSKTFFIDFKVILLTFMFMLAPLVFYNKKNYNINDAMFLIASILFLGIAFNILIVLRNISIINIIYIALITVLTDTFAHFWGTHIGKHKLCPKVSPNKTIEGFIGGTLMGTIIGTLYYITVFNYNNLFLIIFMILLLSLIGQLGDLIFSAIKRKYEIKDFGNVMPGHGGVLDRLDSILFVCIAYTFILTIF